MNQTLDEKYKDYYTAHADCANCKEECRFVYDLQLDKSLIIPKGTKIGDLPCPLCGCQTLYGNSATIYPELPGLRIWKNGKWQDFHKQNGGKQC